MNQTKTVFSLSVTMDNKTVESFVADLETAAEKINEAKADNKPVKVISGLNVPESSFSTPISIPAMTKAEIRLVYNHQIKRTISGFRYTTKLKTFGIFENVEINVDVKETRPITMAKLSIGDRNFKLDRNISDPNQANARVEYERDEIEDFDEDVNIIYQVEKPPLDGGDIIINCPENKDKGYFIHFLDPDLPPLEKGSES